MAGGAAGRVPLSVRLHEVMATETKAPAAKPTPKKKRARRKVNKSGAIREFIQAHPEVGPTAVAAALKEKGIVVSAAHVSNVKAAMQNKGANGSSGGAAAGGRKPGRPGRKAGAGDAVSLAGLLEARKFAAQVGGVESAVTLLQSLAKLQ